MFSNAFLSTRPDQPITLVGSEGLTGWSSMRDVRRTIERWQTKAFVHSAMEALCVQTPYQLERLVMEGNPDLGFPDNRPHCFDRMARLGEPAVMRHLADEEFLRPPHRWLAELLVLAPSARSVMSEPIWRLLDPKPLSWIELCDLDEKFRRQFHSESQNEPHIELFWTRRYLTNYVPGLWSPSRKTLAALLLTMRMCEAEADLRAYWMHLREARRICRWPYSLPCLTLFGQSCVDFLARCFGHVHVAYLDRPEVQHDFMELANFLLSISGHEYPEDIACLNAIVGRWR